MVESGAIRFSRDVALTLGARIFIAGGSLLTGVIIARTLGAESVGILASLSVLTVLAVTFGGFGLPSAITFIVARQNNRLKRVVLYAVLLAFVIGGMLAAAIAALANFRPGLFGSVPVILVVITVCVIPFHLVSMFCLAALLGLRRMEIYNLLDMLPPLLLVINPMIVLIVLRLGVFELVVVNSVSLLILSLFVLVMLIRTAQDQTYGGWQFESGLLKEMFRLGSRFYFAMAASIVVFRADLLIVNYFRDPSEAGVYAVSTQVGTLLMLIPTVISTVLFPKASEAGESSAEMTSRVTRHASLIMLLVCLAAVPLAFLLPLIFGRAFSGATVQVLILLPGVFLCGIETVQVQYFSGIGLPRMIPFFWGVVMMFSFILDLALVPFYGANGAAAVSSVSYSLIFVLVAIYFRSKTGIPFARTLFVDGSELRDLLNLRRHYSVASGGGR
jgi:O-antigen/teichoic acid export membrane protein